MRELFIRAILLVPIYLLHPPGITGNLQHFPEKRLFGQETAVNTINTATGDPRNINSMIPVIRSFQMDIYPAEVFTNIGYFHLDPNIAGGYGKATAYLLSSSEAKTRKTNSLKTPEKTTTVLFVLASVITLIGSAQLASKLQFSRTEI